MQEMILHVAVPATRFFDPKDGKAVLMCNRIFFYFLLVYEHIHMARK